MSADTHAAGQLRAFLERIERLEEERKTIADDIAEVFAELKDSGFDKDAAKVVLKIRKNADALAVWTVHSQTVDVYLSALGMLPQTLPAHAPAHAREIIEQIPPHDAETGEIIEQISTAPDRNGANTENDHVDGSAMRAGHAGQPVYALSGQIESRNSDVEIVDGNASLATREGEQAVAPIPEPFEPPAFLLKAPKPLRPLCLAASPSECAGYGSHTCHRCLVAAGQKEIAA